MTESSVTCPYYEPNCDADMAPNGRRCRCGRAVTRCTECGVHNRAFANFCRSCGRGLPVSPSNWTGYRGSTRRLGFNATDGAGYSGTTKVPLTLRLGEECRALLGYDQHLIAVSKNGIVEIADVLSTESSCRFQVQGRVAAQPCIRNGVLYLAAGRQLFAYALGAMTFVPPRVRPLWTVAFDGPPIHALTPVGNSLYVTVGTPGGREVQIIENVDHPGKPRTIHKATKTSWLAADTHRRQAVFFSEAEGGGIELHLAGPELVSRAVAVQSVPEHPIAVIGDTVFGIFGESHRLYRIDGSTGAIEESLEEDTQFFALSHTADDEWDRESVLIDTAGILFSRSGIRDTFGQHDRAVKGSPLIVRNKAAVIGMEDGRVRIYDLAHPPRHAIWLVGGGTAPITALASFDQYIAAGNEQGVVELHAIDMKGGTA